MVIVCEKEVKIKQDKYQRFRAGVGSFMLQISLH